eukprot:5858251-Pyramimonas_sp.AAC.1
MPPTSPKTAVRRLQVATEPPWDAPERPKSFPNLREINCACILAFSLLAGELRPQDGSNMAHEDPKRGPRRIGDGSKTAPRAPRGPQEAMFSFSTGER